MTRTRRTGMNGFAEMSDEADKQII